MTLRTPQAIARHSHRSLMPGQQRPRRVPTARHWMRRWRGCGRRGANRQTGASPINIRIGHYTGAVLEMSKLDGNESDA